MAQLRTLKRAAQIGALLFVLLTATSGLAGPRDHADGFFLRLSGGFGGTSSALEAANNKVEINGAAGDLNLAIGGMVSANLALHGTFFGWSTADPTVKINGDEVGNIDGTVSTGAAGIGLTYYFMPTNLYVSGSIGAGRMSLKVGALEGETDRGLFLNLTLGKEWWVGDKWALGVAGGLQHHQFGDPDSAVDWDGTSFAIRFTASMN